MKLNSTLLIGAVLALQVSGCKSDSGCQIVSVSPPLLTTEQRGNVWLPDQVAPYAVGRYLDPRDPNLLHEGHTLYRREQTSRPNLTPPAALILPPPGSASASNATAMLRDALTAELNDQRALSQVLVGQVKSVEQLLRNLSARTQEFRDAAQDFTRLSAQLQAMSNRCDQLESRLRGEPARPGPGSVTNSPASQP